MTGPPASIAKVVDEDVGRVNLTVGLEGNICGQIVIEFQVSNSNCLYYLLQQTVQYSIL